MMCYPILKCGVVSRVLSEIDVRSRESGDTRQAGAQPYL